MTHTYLFYDIETTGLNPCFDQVLQFAAIRTDLQLNEIDRHEIRIKLNPDIIPAPMACLTHQQGIDVMQHGMNEYDGIRKIHAWMNTPGTISLGYNTLGFDDEFLRFSFYRNLLPPYTHQYANQCYRMDIFPLTVMYTLFSRDTLNWPTKNDTLTLRLEHINEANQLASGMAHDAMVDVEVTVALAKKLLTNPTLWEYCCGYMQKNTDMDRLSKLNTKVNIGSASHTLAYAVSAKIGARNHFIAPVIHLGTHTKYRNQTLWLRLDQIDFASYPNDLIEKAYVIKKKAAENIFILPYHDRYQSNIESERQEQTQQNLQWLQQHTEKLNELCQHHQNFTYPSVDHLDSDAALYELPFASAKEQSTMRQFHKATHDEKRTICESFDNPTWYELSQRLMCKHFPEHLSTTDKQEFAQYVNKVFNKKTNEPIIDYRSTQKLNAKAALAEIKALLSSPDTSSHDRSILNQLNQYILEKSQTITHQ